MKRWTKEDILFVTNNSELGVAELAKITGRTINAIKHKLCEHGLYERRWTKQEVAILYESNRNTKIAKCKLNRSDDSIRKKFLELKITKRFPTQEEIDSHDSISWYESLADEYKIDIKNILSKTKFHKSLIKTRLSMIERCYCKSHKAYKNYGGRGIRVCDKWLESWVNFTIWAINNGYAKGLSLDRIDNNLEYSETNCRFVTMITQQNNKRNNIKLMAFNESKTIGEWARDPRCIVKYSTLLMRYNTNKLTPEEMITKKSRNRSEEIRDL